MKRATERAKVDGNITKSNQKSYSDSDKTDMLLQSFWYKLDRPISLTADATGSQHLANKLESGTCASETSDSTRTKRRKSRSESTL
jgi:hypothetical protein